MTYIPRALAGELEQALKEYPVVTVLGPRQSGKTTFVVNEKPEWAYVNLEDPDQRLLAANDPRGFLASLGRPLIIDEIQRVPNLLSYIQVETDRSNDTGRFILTGSHQLELGAAISQSLAGRTAVLTLLPLSLEELGDSIRNESREQTLVTGFLPRVRSHGQTPGKAYANYFQTYVERDLRSLIMVKELDRFETFLRLLAGRTGQLFVASSLAADVGVSYKTIQAWVSILEASYLVFKLPPFHGNYGKRLTKSPKLYFTEPGLATWLLGIETPAQASRDPLFGNLFENLVVVEALKTRLNAGRNPSLYFYRDERGLEVDLVLDRKPDAYPIEIKASMSFHPELLKGLEAFPARPAEAPFGTLLYSGDMAAPEGKFAIRNYRETGAVVREAFAV